MSIEHDLRYSAPSVVLATIEKFAWTILALLSIGVFAAASMSHAAGIAIGGIISLANFRCIELYFSLIFQPKTNRLKWWHHAIYCARFLVFLGFVAGIIAWAKLPVVSVAVGLSAPLMGILSYAVVAIAKRGDIVKA